MSQEKVWEKEYRNPILVTKHNKPQADALRFFKFAKKRLGGDWSDKKVLDLGSGTGRNANYLAREGAEVIGLEVSDTAIELAQKRTTGLVNPPKYLKMSMGEAWPLDSGSIDIVIDLLSSNCLTESERRVYLNELSRVTKPGGLILVKTLAKEGDKNAQNLIRKFPGAEKDTYVMPDLGLTERVFTESDFRELYQAFKIYKFEKKSSHIPFKGQIFNRRFIVAYLEKKS